VRINRRFGLLNVDYKVREAVESTAGVGRLTSDVCQPTHAHKFMSFGTIANFEPSCYTDRVGHILDTANDARFVGLRFFEEFFHSPNPPWRRLIFPGMPGLPHPVRIRGPLSCEA
jgi:hypothetical protein